MKESIAGIFARLSPPNKEGTYSASRIKKSGWLRIGKDAGGAPVFFIKITIPESQIIAPRVNLENIAITYNQDFEISLDTGAKERGQFLLISCLSSSPALHNYFIDAVGTLVSRFGSSPKPSELVRGVEHLKELFSAQLRPGTRTIHGLWGELFAIVTSSRPTAMVAAWHSDPLERYDFSDGACRVEVKTCTSLPRQHHFSLEQINPPRGTNATIASLVAPASTGGMSVLDLADRIRKEIKSDMDLLDKFNLVMAQSLGNSMNNIENIRYDFYHAKSTMEYFDSEDIPSVNREVPPEVSRIHFVADISAAKSISLKTLRSRGGIYSAL